MADKNASMLELYADSYDSMAKTGDGKVSASNVAYDIRYNMINQLVRVKEDEVLRDTFAINALIGIGTWMPMPDQGMPNLTTEASLRARAEWAYRQADAMIAARKGGAA